jgi:hypothetical protein
MHSLEAGEVLYSLLQLLKQRAFQRILQPLLPVSFVWL